MTTGCLEEENRRRTRIGTKKVMRGSKRKKKTKAKKKKKGNTKKKEKKKEKEKTNLMKKSCNRHRTKPRQLLYFKVPGFQARHVCQDIAKILHK